MQFQGLSVALRRTKPQQMRSRVTFYKRDPAASANSDGQIPEQGLEQFSRWGHLIPTRGNERYLAEQTVGDITWLLRVRYDHSTASIDSNWWLKIDNRRLNVSRAYDPDGLKREIEMELIERT